MTRCLAFAAAVAAAGACTSSDDDATPDTTRDATDCEILRDDASGQPISCMGATPQDPEVACPDGFECSGLSAFWCYRGDDCRLPICLPAGARIATPNGEVLVTELRVGQLVWTRTSAGERVSEPIVALGSALAPPHHLMLRVTLADGRSTQASPGHPLPNGSSLVEAVAGDPHDGSVIVDAALEPYDGPRTFDLLPAGDTGTYWVDGVLMSSTLGPDALGP